MIDPKKIWTSAQLPTLPSVAMQLLELSNDPDAEIKQVVDVIKADPAISAKILKSTNSTFFGFKSEITSIERAVPLMGTTVVTSLALSFSLVEAAMTSGEMAEHYQQYWLQSITQGAAAEVIGETFGQKSGSEFFMTGLLVDLGRLAMLKTIPEEYLAVLEKTQSEKMELFQIEQEEFGFDHIEISTKLMQHWKLPESLIQAVKHHHLSAAEIENLKETAEYTLIKSIALASAVGDYFCSEAKGWALARLRSLSSRLFDFSDSHLDELLEKIKTRVDEVGNLFNTSTEEMGELGDLMAMASEQLAQLAMREHIANTQATARSQAVEDEYMQLENENRKLEKQALHDALTGIYNRNFFDEALGKEIKRCRRNGSTIGLLFTDIDKFKVLNDTYGHSFGDEVLKKVATVYENALRDSDTLARFGGEEFVILLVQPTEKGLAKIAERVRASIEQEEIFFEGKRVPVTVSIGGVIAIPSYAEDDLQEKLIVQSDEAMYDSKQNGRNQVHVRSLISDEEKQLLQLSMQRRFSRWLVNRGHLDVPTMSKVLTNCTTGHVCFGVLAQQQGVLTTAQVENILEDQKQSHERFGTTAIRLGLLTEETVATILAFQQEDPETLVRQIATQGVLDGREIVSLYQQYKQEVLVSPQQQELAPQF